MDIKINISLPKQQALRFILENAINRDKQAEASPGAPNKLTKEDVNYREALTSKFAKIDENCGTCKNGINPKSDMQPTCVKVSGTVEKRFVCDIYKRGSVNG